MRPGITGYAQVNGRNAISWEEKFEKDVWYVEHISFWTDIKILFKTVTVVFGRKGISSETAVTMEEFKGMEQDSTWCSGCECGCGDVNLRNAF